MKYILVWILLTAGAYAGTCTSVSRTDNSANSVLTSTKYNSDLNTLYTNHNAYDLGCGTDGTLEDGALNTTDFAVVLNAPKEGCRVTKSDSNTLSVDECRIAVNGKWAQTTAADTVTWGCTGCSAEAASTIYYLYVLSTISAGDTDLNGDLLISTTAPGPDGYDGSNNRVLAKFYNSATSNILDGIAHWNGHGFEEPGIMYSCRVEDAGGTPNAEDEQGQCWPWVASVTDNGGVGDYTLNFVSNIFASKPVCGCSVSQNTDAANLDVVCTIGTVATGSVNVLVYDAGGAAAADKEPAVWCQGAR